MCWRVGAVVAGLAVGALTLGWPLSAAQSGRVYLRLGYRACGLIGSSFVVLGCALLLLLNAGSSLWAVAGMCFVIGLGLGLVATPGLIAAQSSVGWAERGVVTGNNMFCRSLGSALGVAAFGAIANATLGSSTAAARGGHSVPALMTASHHVFLTIAGVSLAMTAAIAAMPAVRAATQSNPPTEAAADAGPSAAAATGVAAT